MIEAPVPSADVAAADTGAAGTCAVAGRVDVGARAAGTTDGSALYEGVDSVRCHASAATDWAVLDSSAGLVDANWRCFFPAIGDERRDFLHGQTTGNVKALTAGHGCAALVLTAQGRPLGCFAIYESGERLWIATTIAHASAIRAALSRFLVADDCDFEEDITARCFAVIGPRAADVLALAGAGDADRTDPWAVALATIAGQAVMIFSRGDLRVPSFDVLVCDADGTPGDCAAVESALLIAGAVRCGVDALEILRVESGTARYGVDVDEKRIAVEARLEWAIHFAKGCYVGQEVIERAVSRGRINHELSLLHVDGDVVPGARVDGGSDGDVVTSVVTSPRSGPLALAYLPKAKAVEGASVTLRGSDSDGNAVVLPWPRARTLAGRR